MACVASPPLATVPSAVGSIIAQDASASGVATLPSATFAANAGFPAARITLPVPTNATYIVRIPAKRTIKTIALIVIAIRVCFPANPAISAWNRTDNSVLVDISSARATEIEPYTTRGVKFATLMGASGTHVFRYNAAQNNGSYYIREERKGI